MTAIAVADTPVPSKPEPRQSPPSDLAFTVAYPVLREALDALKAFLPARAPVPVLGGVLFTASGVDDTVIAQVFDFETSVRIPLPTLNRVPLEGATLVSFDKLAKLVAGAAKGEKKAEQALLTVEISPANREAVTVAAAGFTVPLPTLTRDDYPQLPEPSECTVTVDRKTLLGALTRVRVAVGKDQTLPMLSGARLEAEDGVLTLATTDRFRLAVARVPFKGEGFAHPLLIDPKVLGELLKRFEGSDDDTVQLGATFTERGNAHRSWADAERFTVRAGDVVATSRPLDAEFPRYRALLPKPEDTRIVTVNREELHTAVVKAKALSEAVDGRGSCLRLRLSHASITVVPAVDSDVTDGLQQVQGRVVFAQVDSSLADEEFQIGFNPGYLLDQLEAFSCDTLQLGFTTAPRPMLARDVEEGSAPEPAFEYLQMPVRLQ